MEFPARPGFVGGVFRFCFCFSLVGVGLLKKFFCFASTESVAKKLLCAEVGYAKNIFTPEAIFLLEAMVFLRIRELLLCSCGFGNESVVRRPERTNASARFATVSCIRQLNLSSVCNAYT